MGRAYWDYYRTIEDDLLVASRYVEFDPKNYSCYSIEFARLLLAAGSELDMVFKKLCTQIDPTSQAESISQYHPIVTGKFPNLISAVRFVRRFQLMVSPFIGWTSNDAPAWWTMGFNKIKHQRDVFFGQATLENTLNAVAALQIVLFHLYSMLEGRSGVFGVSEYPRLFVPMTSTGDPDREVNCQVINFLQ